MNLIKTQKNDGNLRLTTNYVDLPDPYNSANKSKIDPSIALNQIYDVAYGLL